MIREKSKERIILGIDPGTAVMGYGVLKETGNKIELISLGVVKMTHLDDHFLKLQKIFERTTVLIEQYNPDCIALEAPFYGKNIQVMLKLGRAQGVAMAAGLAKGLPIFEYSPKKVKQSITGNGNADKEQVWKMLQHYLQFKAKPKYFDATDALSVALCHHFQTSGTVLKSTGKLKGWDDFLKQNPGRIKK